MTMNNLALRIDPDAILVDHLFQPMIDGLGVDPERWSWRLYRAFVITMVTSGAALVSLQVRGVLPSTPVDMYVGIPCMVFGLIGITHAMLRSPDYPPLRMVAPAFRLLMAVLAIRSLPVIVLSILGDAEVPSQATQGDTPLMMRMMGFSLSLAFPLGACSLYVRICRRPPRRRPRWKFARA